MLRLVKKVTAMSKLVMVISDEEEGESLALTKAQSIAAPLNAEVEVVRFLPQSCSDADRQSATQSIGELVHTVFKEMDCVTSQVVTTESIPEWVADHCNDGHDSLVIKTGHRSESLFHTPSDWQLIRQLHSPLLISSNLKWNSLPNVLIALDLSSDDPEHLELNEQALQWAKQWHTISDYTLHAVYSVPIPAPLLALDIVEQREYQRAHEPEAKEKLCVLLNKFNMPDVTPHIVTGAPHKTIPHMANELKADLVIMGSVGREGIQGFLRGNTAEKILHHLRTDILVVKPSMAH